MPGWFESQTTVLAIHRWLPFGSRSCVLFWCTKRRWGGDGWLIPDILLQKYYFNAAKVNPDFHDWKAVWSRISFSPLYPHLHSATLHLAYINWCCLFVSAGAHRLGSSSWCAPVHARPIQPPPEASKQPCHVGWHCCQKGDKSENVNRMRRNVCQRLWRRPLHCDYHHLIFMRAYLRRAELSAALTAHREAVWLWWKPKWCNRGVVLQACQYVYNMCNLCQRSIQQEESNIRCQMGTRRPGSLCRRGED